MKLSTWLILSAAAFYLVAADDREFNAYLATEEDVLGATALVVTVTFKFDSLASGETTTCAVGGLLYAEWNGGAGTILDEKYNGQKTITADENGQGSFDMSFSANTICSQGKDPYLVQGLTTSCDDGTSYDMNQGSYVFSPSYSVEQFQGCVPTETPSSIPSAAPTAAPTATCGNGIVDLPEEACDGSDLSGFDCSSFGYEGGVLACSDQCQLDVSSCTLCGDSVISGDEECESVDLNGMSCVDLGFHGGTLSCSTTCKYDTSSCAACGDGSIQSPELCDGSNLNGLGCVDFGFDGGVLGCTDTCQFDKYSCYLCGDELVNGNEDCDGSDLGEMTCSDLGFIGGNLSCSSSCDFDTSQCTTSTPSLRPSGTPSRNPTAAPSPSPSLGPSQSSYPSIAPSKTPSHSPSKGPTTSPSAAPTDGPSLGPTSHPTATPSLAPTQTPTMMPTFSTSVVLWSEDFNAATTNAMYVPNLFWDTDAPESQMSGDHVTWNDDTQGLLRIRLHDEPAQSGDVSAGFVFIVEVNEDVNRAVLSFRYRADDYGTGFKDASSRGDVLVDFDGQETLVDSFDISSTHIKSWQTYSLDVGSLMAGSQYTIKIGGYLTYDYPASNDDNVETDETHILWWRFNDMALSQIA